MGSKKNDYSILVKPFQSENELKWIIGYPFKKSSKFYLDIDGKYVFPHAAKLKTMQYLSSNKNISIRMVSSQEIDISEIPDIEHFMMFLKHHRSYRRTKYNITIKSMINEYSRNEITIQVPDGFLYDIEDMLDINTNIDVEPLTTLNLYYNIYDKEFKLSVILYDREINNISLKNSIFIGEIEFSSDDIENGLKLYNLPKINNSEFIINANKNPLGYITTVWDLSRNLQEYKINMINKIYSEEGIKFIEKLLTKKRILISECDDYLLNSIIELNLGSIDSDNYIYLNKKYMY